MRSNRVPFRSAPGRIATHSSVVQGRAPLLGRPIAAAELSRMQHQRCLQRLTLAGMLAACLACRCLGLPACLSGVGLHAAAFFSLVAIILKATNHERCSPMQLTPAVGVSPCRRPHMSAACRRCRPPSL
jgi:hypothetical protein